MIAPIPLGANQPAARFYRGGQRIAHFRGTGTADPNTPEDWVASTTSVRGNDPVGQTTLPDGRMLADAIEAAPHDWLGPQHVARFGVDTMLLVKLLDAGQRLPVHAHPDGPFAARHLGAAHGKAEAWFLLTPGTVHLGLTRGVTPAELGAIVQRQDSAALLALMHAVEVDAGDAVFVPPGVLHAVGEGILLAEVQEPEDLSILLEWTGFELDGERDGHLGLGFEVALEAVERHGRDDVEELVLRAPAEGSVLPAGADPYFRLDRVSAGATFEPGFAVVIALEPGARLVPDTGVAQDLPAGTTTVVPFSTGAYRIEGSALVARPPRA